jgi:hypothetical protein
MSLRVFAIAVLWMTGAGLQPLQLHSQDFTFQNIHWGESSARVHTLLRGLGYGYSHTNPQGDLIFTNSNEVQVAAMLTEDRLVGVTVTVSGTPAEMKGVFDTLVTRASEGHGSPTNLHRGNVIAGVWESSWHAGQTSMSLTLVLPPEPNGSGTSTLFVNYGGPGYTEELSRRFEAFSARVQAEQRRWATDRLSGSRWEILYATDSIAVSFDRVRTSRSGPIVMAWLRWDNRSPHTATRGHRYDSSITRVEIQCSTLRNREYNRIDYLGTQNVYAYSPEPTPWDEAIPESVGEEVFQTVCNRAQSSRR